MKPIGKQVLHSLIFSAILIALVVAVDQIDSSNSVIHNGVYGIMIFSALLGLVIAFVAAWGMKNMDAQSRPNLFMAITGIRMIVSLIFVLIVVYTGLENRTIWVANFFGVYLFYLVFEIYAIMSNLRAISNEGEKK